IAIVTAACGAPDLTFADDSPPDGGSSAGAGGFAMGAGGGFTGAGGGFMGVGGGFTGAGGAFTGAGGSCFGGACQPCPRDMVNVPAAAGASYCMDALEVTVAGY